MNKPVADPRPGGGRRKRSTILRVWAAGALLLVAAVPVVLWLIETIEAEFTAMVVAVVAVVVWTVGCGVAALVRRASR